MTDIIIHNAKVCLSDKIIIANVLLRDGLIYRIGVEINEYPGANIIEAKDNYLLPGFIDVHTHLDDIIGGYSLEDTYKSGSQVAIENGITSIYSFITQSKNENLLQCVNQIKEKAEKNSFCNIGWHITPTDYREEAVSELNELLKQGYRTIKLYTTYKDAGIYSSYEEIEKLAKLVKKCDATIMIHCEDEETLLEKRNDSFDLTDAYSHSLMRTEKAEIKAIERIIEIAKKTGSRFHVVHVSTSEGIEKINQAKGEVNITCETGPQYLLLNNSMLKGEDGYKYLCTPPLRDELSQVSLYEKAINDEIDVYATDHCAFIKTDKSEYKKDMLKTPKGLPGIGALIPMIYEINKYKGDECFLHMAKHLSENPARMVDKFPRKGIIQEGSDADLILLCVGELRQVKATYSDSFDPYEDFETDLYISKVFLKGEIIVEDNKLINSEVPKGELL